MISDQSYAIWDPKIPAIPESEQFSMKGRSGRFLSSIKNRSRYRHIWKAEKKRSQLLR